jgi:putative hemin transport protein
MTTANLLDLPVEQRRQIIGEKLAAKPSGMTIQFARELKVPEIEVIRALPTGNVIELDVAQWEPMIREFESLEKLHVISSNGAVTLECFGQFGNFSTWGDYFNVQTASLDMHIRYKQLASIFAVTKPGHMDAVPTVSIQFYDDAGDSAFKVFFSFGGRPPTAERKAKFDQLCRQFSLNKVRENEQVDQG